MIHKNNAMILLCGLPKSHLVVILCDWIDCISLCRLDSATTPHSRRNVFLNFLTEPFFTLKDDFKHSNKYSNLSWIFVRRIKCNSLTVNRPFDKSVAQLINKNDCSSVVRHLTLGESSSHIYPPAVLLTIYQNMS